MTTWKLGRQRLLFLADVLDIVDKGHELSGERTYSQSAFVHPCGAPACALGHYAAQFPRKYQFKDVTSAVTDHQKIVLAYRDGLYVSYDDNRTINEFSITHDEARELFAGYGCGGAENAKEAAAYIRKFVARKDRRMRARKAKSK